MDVLESGRGREDRRSLEEEVSRYACLEKRRSRTRPSAVLEWDEAQHKVVARRMQVGLSVRHLSVSAQESASYNKRTGLVDTFVVPDELAELKDLKSILSFETWRTCLTEDERQYLCQYLPKGVDAEAAVSSLLHGDNLFAKSPFLLWGSAVCDGSLHPDILASGGFQTLSSGKTRSAGVWGYYEKLEALWNKRRGVDNHSPAHIEREGIETNACGSQNKMQLQNVSLQSLRQLIHVGSQDDHAKEERHIDNTSDTLNLRKKRKVSTYQEDVEQANTSIRPVMSKWLEKHSVTSAGDPRTVEEPPVGVCVIKVSKRQFAVLMEKRDSGEYIRLHTLQAVLDTSVEQSGSDALHDYWQKQVVRELPLGHETFTKRKVQQAGRALLAAQLCVHQRGHVLTPTQLSYSHVAADREAVVKRVGKESLSTNLLDQRRHSYQQASTAEDEEEQGVKKPAVVPLTAFGRCEPQSFGSCTLSRSYDEDTSIEDTHILHQPPGHMDIAGECLRSSKAGKESPPSPQVAHHLVIHEGKDVSDEESPIHQMWTSVSPDTQIFSSAESLEPASKDRDVHGMKLFANFWDPVKTVEGVATMGAVRSCLTREEPERATVTGSDHTASEINLDGFSGNGPYANSVFTHKKRTRHLDQDESHMDLRSSGHPNDFEIGHLHETVRDHGRDGREGQEDHFQRQDSMQHDHRLSGCSPLVLQRGRVSENGTGSQSSKSHFTKQPLSNDLLLPSQRQRSQFSFQDSDLDNGQRSSAHGYETNFGKESYYFTAPSKQGVPHFVGTQPQHQEDLSPLHHFEHHRLQTSSGMFSQSKSPPARFSEPAHFFPGSQHIVSQLEADQEQEQGQGRWSTGSEKSSCVCWGPSETSPGQTITVAFERPSSPHWEQPSRQQSGNTAHMLEMQKNAIHQAHQSWTPIPAVAVSHNNPSPEQGLAGYSLGPLG